MIGNPEKNQAALEIKSQLLGQRITQEILAAFGLPRDSRFLPLIEKIFHRPIKRFAYLAAIFDEEAAQSGLNGGAQKVIPYFPLTVKTWGKECIRPSGPVLIVCNHPGAYDSLALTSSIPRKDLKLLASDIPFSRALEKAKRNLIYVDFTPTGGAQAMISSMQSLQNRNAVLIFAHGEVEPDPEFMQGANESIGGWSNSIEILLRKVPQTRVVLAIASGVFIRGFIQHPLTRLRTNPAARQKLAEFLQLIHQLRGPSDQKADVHISFSEFSFSPDKMEGLMRDLKIKAQELLSNHLQTVSRLPRG
jgi:hypothetical protein